MQSDRVTFHLWYKADEWFFPRAGATKHDLCVWTGKYEHHKIQLRINDEHVKSSNLFLAHMDIMGAHLSINASKKTDAQFLCLHLRLTCDCSFIFMFVFKNISPTEVIRKSLWKRSLCWDKILQHVILLQQWRINKVHYLSFILRFLRLFFFQLVYKIKMINLFEEAFHTQLLWHFHSCV